ncbi:GNAT family N-acetyltransferase [Kitasatospora sp. NPDC003701]
MTRPYDQPALLEAELAAVLAEWSTTRLRLEDPYLLLDMSRYGCVHGPAMPVMAREPGSLEAPLLGALPSSGALRGGDLTVDEALDADAFAEVEHAVVDGFPITDHQPWTRGGMLPDRLRNEPGLRAWRARIGGELAGACLTYDDGRVTGVYWVATLPEQRSRGVARAVLETALAAAHPDRPATLLATELGEPLYRKLGFAVVGRSHWWSLPDPSEQ